jgi:nucleoside-diphosphate-sugar epimerase
VHATYAQHLPQIDTDVAWHCGNLLQPGVAESIVARVRPTHLLHLAWYAVPGKFWDSPQNLLWLRASIELALAFVEHGGARMVATGTCAEYDCRYGYLSEDLTPIMPRTAYAQSKDACRRALEVLQGHGRLQLAWGRVFYLYGPHEPAGRLVSSVASALAHGNPVPCTEGSQLRDYTHVEDIANALVTLLEHDRSGIFNIGSGIAVTVHDLVRQLAVEFGAQSLVRFGALPSHVDEPAMIVADNRRLLSLGWKPHFSLTAGLAHTAAWWRAQCGATTGKLKQERL